MEESESYLSVVIPAFNEDKRLPRTLEEIRPYLDGKAFSYEVIIADDGSGDKTVSIVTAYAEKWLELRTLKLKHAGKGSAARQGCLAAKGKYVLVMDADHPTPIETLDEMLPFMEGHEMVVGVRAFCGEEGSSGRFRRIVGLAQQLLAHLLVFKQSVADSQCGFKLFSRGCNQKVFTRSLVNGGMYDVEIFLIAQNLKLRIFSLPVKWVNKEGSTINILRCILCDPWTLLYIRFMDLLGKYR